MRFARRRSGCRNVVMSWRWTLRVQCDQHDKGIAGPSRADPAGDVFAGPRRPASSAVRRRRSRAIGRRVSSRTHDLPDVRADRARAHGRPAQDAGASATARSGCSAWCSACESSATSTDAVVDRQMVELAALPDDVRDLRRRANAWRARGRRASDRRRPPSCPPRGLDRSDSLRRSRRRRRPTRGSSSPSARAHAAQLRPGTNWRASRLSGPACASKFSLRSRSTSWSRASSARTEGSACASANCVPRSVQREPEESPVWTEGAMR